MKLLKFLKSTSAGGFSLTESVFSLGIGTVAILGGMTLSQHELRLVKSVREANAASHALEERVEQLRLVNWRQMTDPQHLMQHYFPKRPASGQALPALMERVTVTAFPDPAACTPLIIETDEYGTPHLLSSGSGFDKQRLARVNVRVDWLGSEGKSRIRELASIISNGGINSTSLPVMGSEGTSTPASTSTSGTTETTSGGTTSTGGTTNSSTTTTTTTTTTTPTTTTGVGRGNAAGKTGKK